MTESESGDRLIAGEAGISWGLAEFIAAEEFARYRGYWWAPDGRSPPSRRSTSPGYPAGRAADPTGAGRLPPAASPTPMRARRTPR